MGDISKINNIDFSDISTVSRLGSSISADAVLIFNFNGNDGTHEIVDDGNTGHIVAQNGTAQLNTAQKKFGSSSLLLDGNSDYVSLPDHADWDICGSNSDNWTIDMWVKHTDHDSGEAYICHNENADNCWRLYHVDGSGLKFVCNSSGTPIIDTGFGGEITDTNWHHIALCKVANEYGLYLDGVQIAYTQDDSIDTFAGVLYIGKLRDDLYYFSGNLDDIRISHTNAFSASPNAGKTNTITVPTTEHSSDVDTKLLLHCNTLDTSNNHHIPTFNGTAQLSTTQKKFGSASLLLDGNSDYLTIADSDDWDLFADVDADATISAFIYLNALGAEQNIVSQINSVPGEYWSFKVNSSNQLHFSFGETGAIDFILVGGQLAINTWYHVAMIKKGHAVGIYINGVQVAYDYHQFPRTFTADLNIGRNSYSTNEYFNGYIDSLIITTDADMFGVTPNTEVTVRHFKCNDDAEDTVVTDDSNLGIDAVAITNTSNLSVVGKINDAFEFNGSSEYLTFGTDAIFLYTSPFSVSFWLYIDELADVHIAPVPINLKTDGDYGIQFMIYNVDSNYDGLSIGGGSGEMPSKKSTQIATYFVGKWTHIVFTWTGFNSSKTDINQYKLYIDGALSSWTTTGGWANPSQTNWIARGPNVLYHYLKGKMDDIRLYHGVLSLAQVQALYNSGNGTEVINEYTISVPSSESGTSISKINKISY